MELKSAYVNVLGKLMPKGRIWEADSDEERSAEAELLAEVHAFYDLIAKESDVRTATYLLPEWGEVLEVDVEGKTLQAARFDLSLKKNAQGGATPEYFKHLAKSYGYDSELTECVPFVCGLSECASADELGNEDTIYGWDLKLLTPDAVAFRVSESECGDDLGTEPPDIGALSAILQKYKPSHTFLNISFE